jgi:hypothetical protein
LSLVGLIRNLTTGYIRPQFYVIYDKLFTTVTSDQSHDLTETWIVLFKESRETYIDGHDETTEGLIPELHEQWLTPEEQAQRKQDVSVRNGQQRRDTTAHCTTRHYSNQI